MYTIEQVKQAGVDANIHPYHVDELIKSLPPSEQENKRKEFWMNAWTCVASALNCIDSAAATRWADDALRDFDTRFPNN